MKHKYVPREYEPFKNMKEEISGNKENTSLLWTASKSQSG